MFLSKKTGGSQQMGRNQQTTPSQAVLNLGLTPLDGVVELPVLARIRNGFAHLDLFIGTPEHKNALERYRSGEITLRELFHIGWEFVREPKDNLAQSNTPKTP